MYACETGIKDISLICEDQSALNFPQRECVQHLYPSVMGVKIYFIPICEDQSGLKLHPKK